MCGARCARFASSSLHAAAQHTQDSLAFAFTVPPTVAEEEEEGGTNKAIIRKLNKLSLASCA